MEKTIDRNERKINILRQRYPQEVSKIEQVASHNSDLDESDVNELILDLSPYSLDKKVFGMIGKGALGSLGTIASLIGAQMVTSPDAKRAAYAGGAMILASTIAYLINAGRDILQHGERRERVYNSQTQFSEDNLR